MEVLIRNVLRIPTLGALLLLFYCSVNLDENCLNPKASCFVRDTEAFALVSTTPANAATNVAPCTGNPCIAKIVLAFSKPMSTNVTPTLSAEIHDGTGYISAPITSTVFSWSTTTNTNDTLTISIGWSRFPEVSQIRYTLPASALKNAFGEILAADIQQSFTTAGSGQTFTMPDTGQTQCSSGITGTGAMAACPQSLTGQDGDFVDTPNARSFTGPTLYGTNDYTTKDNVTGLVWKTCSEGLSGSTCAAGSATTLTWYNALNQCGILNSANSGAGYGGQKTWRLPTSMELESLPNLGTFSPAIDTAYFPATVSADY